MVGSSRTSRRTFASIQRASTTFCWLPPLRVATTASGSCGLTEKRFENGAAVGEFVAAPDRLQRALSRRDRVEIDILANRHIGGKAFFRPPARNKSDLLAHGARRVGGIDPAALQGDMARR